MADGSQPTIRILPKRGSGVTTLDEGKADNVAAKLGTKETDGGRKENKKTERERKKGKDKDSAVGACPKTKKGWTGYWWASWEETRIFGN